MNTLSGVLKTFDRDAHLARSLVEAKRVDEAEEALAWAERLGTHPRDVAAARKVLAERLAADAQAALR